jgi:hypothetical protein
VRIKTEAAPYPATGSRFPYQRTSAASPLFLFWLSGVSVLQKKPKK